MITAKVYLIMIEFGYRDVENIKIILNDRSFKKLEDYDPLYYPNVLINNNEDKKIKPIEIPCIMVIVENIHDKLLCSLKERFNRSGYNTLLILIDESHVLDTSYHIVAEELCNDTLVYIASKYEVDLIIIGLGDANSIIPSVSCDILFYHEFEYGESNYLLCSEISYEFKIGYMMESYLVEFIYQKTTELLV